ncbi:ABC transporter permease [Bacillus sp. HSf4]|uniref:ABC transporter permease n=1 Tax=Bacillus sp. HSf4 TaxID=3035514 RepID=UPI00240976A9|nr:ABC transporter permease [Bacillus sp. HSf4]WFA04178.1 ABC transporter permease [Bacillus sp. HSf4]
MNGQSLFRSRLKADYRYQLRVLNLVIDWTVWLYIVLPGIAILVYQYIKWVNGGAVTQHEWHAGMVLLIPALFTLFGSVRTFLMEADQLYLLQKKTVIFEMKVCGFVYCLSLQLCKWLLLIAVCAPVYINKLQMDLSVCIAVFFFYLCINLFMISLKQLHLKRPPRLKYRLLHAGEVLLVLICASFAVLSASMYVLIGVALVLAVAAVYSIMASLKDLFLFYDQVDAETKHKLKLAAFFLSFNQDGTIPKPGKTTRAKKPRLFFRKSQPLFQTRTVQNGCREVFFKVMLRHPDYKRQLIRLISIFTALILLGPVWLKAIALLIFAAAYRNLVAIQFDKVMERSYLLGADHDSTAYREARRSCINWLFFPGLIWCCVNLAVSLLFKAPSSF